MAFGARDTQIQEMIIQAKDEATETLHHVGEEFRRVAEIAGGFTLGAIGYSAISQAIGGIEELGRGLIETNATAEQLTQTLHAIYGSGAEAQQAMGWLTQFAMAAPFTRESIQQAGVTIASLGMDITQVLPALGNLAGVMGTDMPTAAQAFMDAFEGRFQMMQRDLHVSKQQLEGYGLVVKANGQIVQDSFAGAFERFVAARYPEGMALQMQTFNGQMSNLVDHWQQIERVAGQGLFDNIKGELKGTIDFLNTNQGAVLAFADAVGQGLATAMRGVGALASTIMTDVPPAVGILRGLWADMEPDIMPAVNAVRGAVQTIEDYLQKHLQPTVRAVLTQVVVWWDEHGNEVLKALSTVTADFQKFLLFLGSNMASGLEIVRGIAQVGWGAIQGAFALGQTVVEADATKHSNALLGAYRTVMFGFDDVFEAMEIAVARFLDQGLAPAIDQFHNWANKALQPFETWAANVGGIFVSLWFNLQNTIANLEDGILRQLNAFQSKIPAGIPGIGAFHAEALPAGQRFVPLPHLDVAVDVAKVMPSLYQFTGANQSGYVTQASQVNVDADIKRVRAFFTTQREQTLKDLYSSFGDQQALTELLRMRGVQGPTHPTSAADQAAADNKAQAEIDAFMKHLQKLAGTGLDFGTLGGALSGAKGKADHLPVANAGDQGDPAVQKAALATAVAQDQKRFELDRLNHASQQKLLADIAAILADMKKAGATQLDLDLERKHDLALLQAGAKQSTTTGGLLPAMAGAAARPGQQAGLGTTIVDYGFGARDNWAAVIASLQRQLAVAREQNALLRQLLAAAQKTADHVSRPGEGASSLLRRHGLPQPAL